MKKFKIKISGEREPIFVSYVEGQAIARSWANDNVSESSIIPIGSGKFRKSEIKYVQEFEDREQESRTQGDNSRNKIDQEYSDIHKKLANRTPEEKSKKMEWFKTVYRCFSGLKEPSSDLKVQVYNIQLKFFRENPKRIHCDPTLFKPIIPCVKDFSETFGNDIDRDTTNKRSQGLSKSYAMIIALAMAEDKKQARLN